MALAYCAPAGDTRRGPISLQVGKCGAEPGLVGTQFFEGRI